MQERAAEQTPATSPHAGRMPAPPEKGYLPPSELIAVCVGGNPHANRACQPISISVFSFLFLLTSGAC